jgi:glutathione peroxidase
VLAAASCAILDSQPDFERSAMSIYDVKVSSLDGKPTDLSSFQGKALLIVNVASQCGLTPQYAGLQQLHEEYGSRGFEVLGFPCNQFGAQEPGTPEEIATFCETKYGVEFPLFEKIEVNGDGRHPLYQQLTEVADAEGASGDIRWNFEKFLVSADGEIVARFGPMIEPDNAELVGSIEAQLPA